MFQQYLYHHHNTLPPSALLFPAVDPRHRYLIHSTVHDHFPALTSVSVGEGDERRTAVSFRTTTNTVIERQLDAPEQEEPQQQVEQRKQHRPPPPLLQQQKQESQPQHSTQRQQNRPQEQCQLQTEGSLQHRKRGQSQKQCQQKQQHPQFKSNRSRSSSSSQSASQGRRRGGPSQQLAAAAPQHSSTEQGCSEQLKNSSEEPHSKKRRNRKNKRHRDKAEQQEKDSNNHVNSYVDKNGEESDANLINRGSETVKGNNKTNASHFCNGAEPVRVTQVTEGEEEEGWSGVNSVKEGDIYKKRKSVGESSAWKTNRTRTKNTREECSNRLCGPTEGSTSPPSRQEAHHRMPVTTMSPETSTNNKRRGKAAAQIYRPPPARGTPEDTSPSQLQQYHYQAKQPHNHNHQELHRDHYHQDHFMYNPNSNHHHTFPLVSRQRTDSECSNTTAASDIYGKNRGRRPDQVLYVPRGRRHTPADTNSARATPTPVQDFEPLARPPSPTYSICSVSSEFSGRNRYNRQGSRQGSQVSLYDGDADRVKGKPPVLKGEPVRETTPGHNRQKGGGRFTNQTYQLIERCLNQDSDSRHSEPASWENDSLHVYHNGKINDGGWPGQKSPTPNREVHSIHSKENIISPVESNRRSRKRRSRRRHSRSREPSSDQTTAGRAKTNDKGPPAPCSLNNQDHPGSLGDRGFGSCERVFYNSNYNSLERYDRGYDNYDRYSSINNSRASSRNPSLERPSYNPNLNWREGGSNPTSPTKGNVTYYHKGSPGKPPSGRLGSLPNVALDLGERSTQRDATERFYTLPVQHHKVNSGAHAGQVEMDHLRPEGHRNGGSAVDRISARTSEGQNWRDCEVVYEKKIEDKHDVEKITCQSQDHLTSMNFQNSAKPSVENTQQSVPQSSSVDQVDESEAQDITNNHSLNDTESNESESVDKTLDCTETIEESSEDDSEVPATEMVESTEHVEEVHKEQASTGNKEEKKSSKKFAFNWADEVEDSWDSLYDDTGECLDPSIKRQLNDSIGKVKLEKPVNDYHQFQAKEVEINEDDYAHVIEIYDFPTSFKTQDLMMVFSSFQSNGFDIKWVDDNHALGIFSTALMAAEALSINHPLLKTRTLSMATKSSKAKAMRITDALLPYKPRPATSAALARRLVSGALGLKVNISREVREAERQKLKDAKARKRLEAKQRLDAWEGTLT